MAQQNQSPHFRRCELAHHQAIYRLAIHAELGSKNALHDLVQMPSSSTVPTCLALSAISALNEVMPRCPQASA